MAIALGDFQFMTFLIYVAPIDDAIWRRRREYDITRWLALPQACGA
jgi:hypothetical protein